MGCRRLLSVTERLPEPDRRVTGGLLKGKWGLSKDGSLKPQVPGRKPTTEVDHGFHGFHGWVLGLIFMRFGFSPIPDHFCIMYGATEPVTEVTGPAFGARTQHSSRIGPKTVLLESPTRSQVSDSRWAGARCGHGTPCFQRRGWRA